MCSFRPSFPCSKLKYKSEFVVLLPIIFPVYEIMSKFLSVSFRTPVIQPPSIHHPALLSSVYLSPPWDFSFYSLWLYVWFPPPGIPSHHLVCLDPSCASEYNFYCASSVIPYHCVSWKANASFSLCLPHCIYSALYYSIYCSTELDYRWLVHCRLSSCGQDSILCIVL